MSRSADDLYESEEPFRLLVNSVSDYAIFLLDPDGIVASWNLGAERLKGYTADEVVGSHFSRFYTDHDLQADLPGEAIRAAIQNGRSEMEGWRVRKDGSHFWANVVITTLYGSDGAHRGFAKVTRDLTERKRNEDQLREILDREREAAAQLREVDRLRTELLGIVAHDLRAPVGVIKGLVSLLTSEWATSSDAEKLGDLQRISERTERLASLVEDVFALATIEAGELHVEAVPIDLEQLVAQVVADVVKPSDRDRVRMRGAQARAIGDERRTWQVVANLVSNATKFSDGSVDVTIRQADREAVVSVRDAGPGIASHDCGRIFDRFTRLPHNGTPGNGIGLFIAKSFVEAQGGRIWVESELGHGSTFAFALPSS